MRNESHDHSKPTEHNMSPVYRRLHYLIVAPRQILPTIHVSSLENIEHAIITSPLVKSSNVTCSDVT
jgi:hypothetical protein